ncbi:hypothetical protein CesoFtcFv8_023059 [Champsocephalus esox]|uniref:Ferlin C-terminal domain-containing protein n=2 Tax=Champsocephalus TaxID=52236 RepID=A0AAN8H5Q2_CHAGU|nr:hypothetical protein CesoFtcFv8_023059 [Champsocephalus esox]KAK5903471.1 hypothetical protein CgunFtcFv8_007249 [Champsocephalus gunnari]
MCIDGVCLCSRPSSSLSWLLSPLRTLCLLVWRLYRLPCLLLLAALLGLLFLALLLFSVPSELSHKLFNSAG